jgi:hypothetical protein
MRIVRTLALTAVATGAFALVARALKPRPDFPPPRRLPPPPADSFDPLELPKPQQDALLSELGDLT